MKTIVKYGLTCNGELLGVFRSSYNDSYYLTTSANEEPYLVDDPEIIAELLFKDPGEWNGTKEKPAYGSLDDLQPVTVTTIIAPSDIKPIPGITDIIDNRSVSRSVAKIYFPNLPKEYKIFYLIIAKEADYLQFIGQVVAVDSIHNRKRLLNVMPTPEDYPTDRMPSILLVCVDI